jgi:hypothetical protein
MTPLKTIVATALVAVAGTVAAFGGLHIGESSTDAATANQTVKATVTHAMTSTATQREHLMHRHDQDSGTAARAKHHVRQADRDRQGYVARHTSGHHAAGTHNDGSTSVRLQRTNHASGHHYAETGHASGHHHAEAGHSGDRGHHAEGSGSHRGGCSD